MIISAKDLSRLHQFGKKVYLEYSSGMRSLWEEFGKEILWSADIEEWENHGRVRNLSS